MPRPSSPSQYLLGTEYATVDDKGRLSITPEKRFLLTDGFWLAYDPIGCLLILPGHIAMQMLDYINGGDFQASLMFSESARHLLREFSGTLEKGSFDANGRTVIPRHLRDDVGMTKEKTPVRVIGCTHFCEVWEEEAFKEYRRRSLDEKGGSLSALLQESIAQRNRVLDREVPLPKTMEEFDQ